MSYCSKHDWHTKQPKCPICVSDKRYDIFRAGGSVTVDQLSTEKLCGLARMYVEIGLDVAGHYDLTWPEGPALHDVVMLEMAKRLDNSIKDSPVMDKIFRKPGPGEHIHAAGDVPATREDCYYCQAIKTSIEGLG